MASAVPTDGGRGYPVIDNSSAGIVANSFLKLSFQSGRLVTPLKLIKLVYMAYGWWLAVMRERLFDEPIEAWEYGPVVPSLYHEFKRYGRSPILEMSNQVLFSDDVCEDASSKDREDGLCIHCPVPELDAEKATSLKRAIHWVWEKYSPYTAVDLSRMTHEKNTPWRKARDSGVPCLADKDIIEHFGELLLREME